jgi:hypothetical protein
MCSLRRWFNTQHPSDIEAYNDPAAVESLSDANDCFEVTLNDDHGTQYVETHQLSVPPVQCLDTSELAFLGRIAKRVRMLAPEEHARGERVVEHIVRKAQMLLKCAHDALEAKGLHGIGSLFATPIAVEEDEEGRLSVHGSVTEGNPICDINTIDVRARLMQLDNGWEDQIGWDERSWQYPGPDEDDDCADCSSNSELTCMAEELVSNVAAVADAVADALPAAAAKTAPGATFAAASSGPLQGMKRIESWMEDKFTAQQTRTMFPLLSEINHLNHADDVSAASPYDSSATACDLSLSDNIKGPEAVMLGSPAGVEQPRSPILHAGDISISPSASISGSTPGEYRRHVFSVKLPADIGQPNNSRAVESSAVDSVSKSDTELHDAQQQSRVAAHGSKTHVEAATWVQPCVGHLGAAEALFIEVADSMGSGSGDGWRETVLTPIACEANTMQRQVPEPNAAGVAETPTFLDGDLQATIGAAPEDTSSHCAPATLLCSQRQHEHGPASTVTLSVSARSCSAADVSFTIAPAISPAQPDMLSDRSETAAGGAVTSAMGGERASNGIAGDAPASASGEDRAADGAAEGPKECLIGLPVRGILVERDSGIRSATKQAFLEVAPPLLLVHLNRFQHVAAGARKRQAHVAFPFHLFVHPAIAKQHDADQVPADPVRYRLKGVLVHKGLQHDSGHYVCYVWRPSALVRAATKALKWVPPGPSKPISIPHRGTGRRRPGDRRSQDGGRRDRHDLGNLPGNLHTSSSYSNTELVNHAGRLQSGNLSLPGTSLEGVWRAMHSRREPQSNYLELLHGGSVTQAPDGETWSGKMPELPDAGASADLVDWEELADQPVPIHTMRTQSRSTMLRCSSTESSGSLQPAHSSQVTASPPALTKGVREEDGGGAFLHIGELLACESLDDVGVWIMCDDERVRTVSWQTVARESAYMLMYEQV